MTRLLFASGDVGGARALIPVIRRAQARGLRPAVVRHGAIAAEGDAAWAWRAPDDARLLETPEVYVFTGSVKDPVGLRLARRAAERGLPTLFVLDSWSSYTERLCTDGAETFAPTLYCVPDALARTDAAANGVTGAIAVTGQPAFADIAAAPDAVAAVDGSLKLIFVSEPVEADQGRRRGYTEADALALVAAGLQPCAARVSLDILPHPRDVPAGVAALWDAHKGRLRGRVLPQNSVGTLAGYDGITGMASVMLYRAWLLGRAVLSCQPALALDALRQFGKRDGIVLADDPATAVQVIRTWADALEPGRPVVLRPDARLHAAAAETILDLACGLSGHISR